MTKNRFLWDKPFEILTLLRTSKDRLFSYKVSRLTNTTADRTSTILKEFEKMKIINRKKEGRRIYLTLTKEGESIADFLTKIKKLTI